MAPLQVTVTLAGPVGAPAPMVNVALIWVWLTTVTETTAMLPLVVVTAAGAVKLLPVRVTCNAVAP